VVVLAQDEARLLKHNYIGTEHILLGLLREEEGLAAHVLHSLDVTVEEVRAQVARIVGHGDDVTTGQIPFTPRAKKVLELALREALSLGHNYIGGEHILLGLVRENEGVGAQILRDFDADTEKIRSEILRLLARRPGQPEAPPRVRGREARRKRRLERQFSGAVEQWEYTVVKLDGSGTDWEPQLNTLGAGGWELCAIADGHAVLKRLKARGPSVMVIEGTPRD
jgi:ATP-dependent Clp protease ATP-binding subunit ClpC